MFRVYEWICFILELFIGAVCLPFIKQTLLINAADDNVFHSRESQFQVNTKVVHHKLYISNIMGGINVILNTVFALITIVTFVNASISYTLRNQYDCSDLTILTTIKCYHFDNNAGFVRL